MSDLTLEQIEGIAREAHADQLDKSGRPYVEHVQAVADGVRERAALTSRLPLPGCTTRSKMRNSHGHGLNPRIFPSM